MQVVSRCEFGTEFVHIPFSLSELNNDLSFTQTQRQQRQVPTGDQEVPLKDHKRDYEADCGDWERNHFIHCILGGSRKAKIKNFIYSQLAAVHQEDCEPPVTFLHQLKNAIQKHTNVKPGTQEEEIILKDKFLT
jgi:hypothetical protein